MAAIIQSKQVPWQSNDWSKHLNEALADPSELLRRLQLDPASVDYDPDAEFIMRVPEPFLARMRPQDPADPLLRQVLPLRAEHDTAAGFSADPLGEEGATLAPGLIQKYAGRALLIATTACAVHCRYCFRRHFPYTDHRQGLSFPSLRHIDADHSIHEVILSGGDPLMLKDRALSRLIAEIESIGHVRRLRIHTRVPVVIPQRVTMELVAILRETRLNTSVVLHINHPNELDRTLAEALAALHESGAMLLNQSVLLAGVNNNVRALRELSEVLFEHRVLPYYLHLPDKVVGTQHFDVSSTAAQRLMRELSATLPGYLVPRLVRETAGEPAKSVVNFM